MGIKQIKQDTNMLIKINIIKNVEKFFFLINYSCDYRALKIIRSNVYS